MKKSQLIRRYSELVQLGTFEERYNYLRLAGIVGEDTFGFDRWMNQMFYVSKEWKDIRRQVIVRDQGCDLGIIGREIMGKIYVHHMNPLKQEDISNASEYLLNPEYLICTSFDTHQAIHYGDVNQINKNTLVERTPNDTCPWK